jgi:hypothetical protein
MDNLKEIDIADAIALSGGVNWKAAVMLGCSYGTLLGYLKKYPGLQEQLDIHMKIDKLYRTGKSAATDYNTIKRLGE